MLAGMIRSCVDVFFDDEVLAATKFTGNAPVDTKTLSTILCDLRRRGSCGLYHKIITKCQYHNCMAKDLLADVIFKLDINWDACICGVFLPEVVQLFLGNAAIGR